MIFGLVLSVVLTGALATYLANYIQKHIMDSLCGFRFYFNCCSSINHWWIRMIMEFYQLMKLLKNIFN